MCKFETLGVSWPPKGWRQLKNIEHSYGQAILKNPASAIVTGMSYEIEPVPVYLKSNNSTYVYSVHIKGWNYNIYNESCEYSVLSFMLREKLDAHAPKHFYMSDIKTQSQSLRITRRSAHRAFMSALFMMKQINSGQVPEVDRILKLYKIHSTQRTLYDVDRERQDSLFCGLADSFVENTTINE